MFLLHGALPPVIVRTFFGRSRAVAGDGYYDSSLSTRAIAATVIQGLRVPRQNGGKSMTSSFSYIDVPFLKQTENYFGMDLVILNCSQMRRTTPELGTPSSSFRITPYDLQQNGSTCL
ncbi:hypothetical protein AVEN_39466-1 [Araneus ventricosus]|uniref:Uncharacterized protein n=1 Tax=Araneus ventricosus TaxID=182803 RepID=A0A4Y2D7R9_ARAVE|nr:hypothetical protein AVEN_39466-1 [Araneus ventricosus]